MKNNNYDFYTVFADISHIKYQIELHKESIKRAFKHSSELFLNSSGLDIDSLSSSMYKALFIDTNSNTRTILSTIFHNLKEPFTLENFLSNYFYIVVNDYIESFYNLRLGWKRISKFTAAVEDFIDWSQSIDYRVEDTQTLLSDEERAISSLEMIREKKVKITVLNTYQGVPIQYKASVIHTTDSTVFLKVHPIQELAARSQKIIYILAIAPLEYDLFAQVKAVKYKGHTLLELKEFNILKGSLFQRQSVRVQPKSDTQVQLIYDKLTYKVQLFDISLGGLAVVTSKRVDIDKFTSLKIKIPDTLFNKEVIFNAIIVQSSHFENSEKYHFKLNLTNSQETLLSRYIIKRQNEIIQELKKWL